MANLKLMIDEDYWALAPHLDGVCKKVKAVTSESCGCPSGTPDPELVKATSKKRRVLVTLDDSTMMQKLSMLALEASFLFRQKIWERQLLRSYSEIFVYQTKPIVLLGTSLIYTKITL